MSPRPGVISFIGYVMILQAAFGAVQGVVSIALRNEARVLDALGGVTSGQLVVAGSASLVMAAIFAILGFGLLRGSRVSRGLVAAVQILHVMVASWSMFTHHEGAWLFTGLLTVGVAVFVLWALFNERSDAYYAAA
ncbi:MAG: hypothetical protein AB7O74_15075 [Candidatus Nanopelagicales bacterium]